ncbi:MAG: MotA/TolQ/ExbB proton channel family protein [Planctomycetota bacterium]
MQDLLEQTLTISQRGGPVMWPLLALSLVSVTLSTERALFWLVVHRPGRSKWVGDACRALASGDSTLAKSIASRDSSPYAGALSAAADRSAHAGLAIELSEEVRPTFERFAASLATIIAAAPLLGILGTVLGVIRAFNLLGVNEVADIGAVAGGIAQALITTAFGLIVALMTLFPAMLFRAQADRAIGNIERIAAARGGSGNA